MRLIDVDDLGVGRCSKDVLPAAYCAGWNGLLGLIEKAPTVDAVPVVHGRWEWFDEETGTPSTGYEREWGWRCSHCKEELPDDYDDPDDRPAFRFCYNCGAMMDGGVDGAAN